MHTSKTAQASIAQSGILLDILKLLHVQTQLQQEQFSHWFEWN